MKREIRCEDCKQYLGEIREATLMKNIKHYCWPCSEKKQDDTYSPLNDLFNNIGGFKK